MAAPQKCAMRMEQLFRTIAPDRPVPPQSSAGGAAAFSSRVDSIFGALDTNHPQSSSEDAATAGAAAAAWRSSKSGHTASDSERQSGSGSKSGQVARECSTQSSRGGGDARRGGSKERAAAGRGQYCPPHRRGGSGDAARSNCNADGGRDGGRNGARATDTGKRPAMDSSVGAWRADRGGRRGGAVRGGHCAGDRRTGGARSFECIPHYLQDSRKYQRYSLEDVDTSDRANTAAALSFLSSRSGVAKQSSGLGSALESGSGVVQFRPRDRQRGTEQETHRETEREPKKRRVGGLLAEVVVGQQAGGRRQARGKTGRERAIAAGLIDSDDGGQVGAAKKDASGVEDAGPAAAKANQKSARWKAARPSKPMVALSHLHADESDG